MSESEHIRTEVKEGIVRIVLDRPKHNVLDIEMMNALNARLAEIGANSEMKAVVLSGEGRSFCAGVEVADHKPEKVGRMIATFNRIFELIEPLEIPTIAAVHGACLGGGLELAIACDIVVAAESAILGQPEIKLGFLPPYAAIRLPQLVGPARAIEICTTGKRYTAREAQTLGFVSHCVPDEQLAETVDSLVAEISANSPLIIRLNKRAVKNHLGMPFAKALLGVSDLFLNTLMKTRDTLEGIRSFEEKRKPEWQNR